MKRDDALVQEVIPMVAAQSTPLPGAEGRAGGGQVTGPAGSSENLPTSHFLYSEYRLLPVFEYPDQNICHPFESGQTIFDAKKILKQIK